MGTFKTDGNLNFQLFTDEGASEKLASVASELAHSWADSVARENRLEALSRPGTEELALQRQLVGRAIGLLGMDREVERLGSLRRKRNRTMMEVASTPSSPKKGVKS